MSYENILRTVEMLMNTIKDIWSQCVAAARPSNTSTKDYYFLLNQTKANN